MNRSTPTPRRAASRLLAALAAGSTVLASCAPTPAAPTPPPPPKPVSTDRPAPPPPAPTPVPPPPAPTPAPKPTPEPMREVFPGLRLDRAASAVEFDGEIVQDGVELKYLEVLACRPNSREHESIVVSPIPARNLHAALLLTGAIPGKPGSWTFDKKTRTLTPHPPEGPRLAITIRWTEGGQPRERAIGEMVKDEKTGRPLSANAAAGFLFAGSAFLKARDGSERYAADASGTLIGLCTFGDEPVAWSEVVSPEESLEEPEWIVDRTTTPPKGTKVVVRLTLTAPRTPAPDPTPAPAPARP